MRGVEFLTSWFVFIRFNPPFGICDVDLLISFRWLKKLRNCEANTTKARLWESLLGAFRNHGDVELAGHIDRRLLELDSEDSAGYVQLSYIPASMRKWDHVEEPTRKLRTRGVTKEPGCSMVEVNGIVHEFLASEGMISRYGRECLPLEILSNLSDINFKPVLILSEESGSWFLIKFITKKLMW
ncbi:unnamed protein product [Ilex paraguariensis]|uniref:Uncharacterized protein n=1 Tax=Ilex paraguariensis TaxID=185542 RepID=A0ABC8RTL7_9AQUA